MDAPERALPRAEQWTKWQRPETAARYARARFRSRRRAERDPALVRALLARHGPRDGRPPRFLLDAPTGAGRLRGALVGLAGGAVGLDLSPSMLREGRADAALLVHGDLARLPFAPRSFGLVVCCRLLHHQRDPERLRRLVAELVRVCDDRVVASFWDAAALPERVRLRPRRDARVAHAKAELRAVFEAAGARVEGFRHSFRLFSRQTFLVARRPPAEGEGAGAPR